MTDPKAAEMINNMFKNLPPKERLKLKLSSARSNRLPNENRVELRKSAEEEYEKAMKTAMEALQKAKSSNAK